LISDKFDCDQPLVHHLTMLTTIGDLIAVYVSYVMDFDYTLSYKTFYVTDCYRRLRLVQGDCSRLATGERRPQS